MRARTLAAAIPVLIVLCLIGGCGAQQGGSIAGMVQDPSGAVLAGVGVTLQGTGPAKRTLTDGTGQFRFTGLAPGSYLLTSAPHGFSPTRLRVRVAGRPVTGVKLTLKLATATQQVTVSAADTVDTSPADNRDAVTMSQDTLENLPVFDQDYVATLSRFLDAGDEGSGGATLVVNGVEASAVPVSASAIQSVKISNDPYTAASSRPGHGRIEVITKPGEAHFHGEFNLTYRNSALDARNAFAAARPDQHRRIFEGSLTGPVGLGRGNTFVFSADHRAEDEQALVYAITPAGAVNEMVPTPSRDALVSFKLDHHASERNEVSLTYSYSTGSSRNDGVGGFTLPEAASDSTGSQHRLWYNQRTLFSSKLVNQIQVRMERSRSRDDGVDNTSRRVVVQGAFTGGGAQTNDTDLEYNLTGGESLTWSRGRHTMTFGVDVPDWDDRLYNDLDNFAGTYSFATLADYAAGKPYLFTIQRGNGRVEFIEKAVGAYVQDQFQFSPSLTLNAGLRYQWQNYFPANHNWAPRVSLAYAPGHARRTVLRAGAGVFYDRFYAGSIYDLRTHNGAGLESYQLDAPSYPDPFAAGGLSALPPERDQLAPGIGMPYTVQFSAGVERQLGKSTLAATYTGSRQFHQFQSRDLNAPLPPAYGARPDASLGRLRTFESYGRGTSNSVRVLWRGTFTPWLTGLAQYQYGRAYNDTNGLGSYPANPYSMAGEWARANWDQRHRFDFAGTYAAPAGLKLGISVEMESGRPYTETLGEDIYNDGMSNARPAGVARNSLEGPGTFDLDMKLSRSFNLERWKPWFGAHSSPKLNLSVAAFNVPNNVRFNTPVGNLQSPFFGHSVSAGMPRHLQLALRYSF